MTLPPQRASAPDPAAVHDIGARRAAQALLHRHEALLAPQAFLDQIAIEAALGRTEVERVMKRSRTGLDLRRMKDRLQPFVARQIAQYPAPNLAEAAPRAPKTDHPNGPNPTPVPPPAAVLYEGTGGKSGRRLLVIFAGRLGRMMPVALFLQALQADQWDVLVLRDASGVHFQNGCPELADSFPALAGQIKTMGNAYGGLAALGISMGGFCATRLALLIGPFRAVSVGGRPTTDAAQLLGGLALPPAFDPICACLPPANRPHLAFVCAQGQALDLASARNAADLTGGQVMALPGASHGVLWQMYLDGLLAEFLTLSLSP